MVTRLKYNGRALIVITLYMIIGVSFYAKGQELNNDTLRLSNMGLHIPSVYMDEEYQIELPGIYNFHPDTNNIRLLSSFMLSALTRDEFYHIRAESHLLRNYHEFYIEDSRFSLFRQVLGMAQLSAAGYILYRHIKKYGLE